MHVHAMSCLGSSVDQLITHLTALLCCQYSISYSDKSPRFAESFQTICQHAKDIILLKCEKFCATSNPISADTCNK